MKRIGFLLLIFLLDNMLFSAEYELSMSPISFPIYSPYSDEFFASNFETSFGRFSNFFFFNIIVDESLILEGAEAVPENTGGRFFVKRGGFSTGAMFPITRFSDIALSGLMGGSFVWDHAYMAETSNFFIGAGIFGNHIPFDIGIGFFAGYYRERYSELPMSDDGFFHGSLENKPGDITQSVRLILIPRIGLLDRIFFLDEIGAVLGFSGSGNNDILARLAFRRFQAWALRVGIDIYHRRGSYNLLLDYNSFGVRFVTRNILINFGHRQFRHNSTNPFLSNFIDGGYGRLVYKFRPRSGRTPILLSYGFEHTFTIRHFFGIGLGLSASDAIGDMLFEFSREGPFRFTYNFIYGTERQR